MVAIRRFNVKTSLQMLRPQKIKKFKKCHDIHHFLGICMQIENHFKNIEN